MAWQAVAAVGALAWGAKKLLGSSDLDHDETVQATYDALVDAVPADATVYADHITDGPNPRSAVPGLSHVPDVVVKAGSVNNLIVEVETADSLEQARATARQQVAAFSKRGYRRILVVPPGKEDVDAVREFLEEFADLDGQLYLSDPDSVTQFL